MLRAKVVGFPPRLQSYVRAKVRKEDTNKMGQQVENKYPNIISFVFKCDMLMHMFAGCGLSML